MPVYAEMVKDKNGKDVEKKINGKTVYYIRTYVESHDGKRKQITRHNKTWLGRCGYDEARREENVLRQKEFNEFDQMTIGELRDKYIEFINTRLKLSTVKKASDNFRLYIIPFFGANKKIAKIRNIDILNWHEFLLRKGFSNRFNRDIHISLVTLLNHACKYYGLKGNVASIVGNFEVPKGTKKKEMNFLTEQEFNSFIKQENNEIYKLFFTILFYTGLRLGELWCLKWEDVNFKNREIAINKAYNPRNGEILSPKTNKSNRNIIVVSTVLECLNRLKKLSDDEYIFGTKKITGSTLRRKCDKNYKFINETKKLRIHDFRHSFATMCINKGVPIEILSQYLGHENISTTLDIYGHLYPNSQEKLIKILEKQDQKQDQ